MTDVRMECHSIIAQLFFDFCNKKYSRTEVDWIAMHLDLYLVLGGQRTLTAQEFEVIFFHQGIIDYCNKDAAWNHNKTCLVFFLNWYEELLKVMRDAGRGIAVVWNAEWMHAQLTKLDELRANFPFCNACKHDEGECRFWLTVRCSISEILADVPYEMKEITLNAYFKQLDNLCALPKSEREFMHSIEAGET